MAERRIWDPLVRGLHWTLVAAVLGAWLTRHQPGPAHTWCGYVATVVLAVRLIWGWRGSHFARFAQFVRAPAQTLAYLRALVAGRAPRHLGHNPAGAWMIVLLLSGIASLAITGLLYDTDAFWGEAWLADLHESLAWLLLACIAVHVSAVLVMSFAHRENLIRAMLVGRKPVRAGDADAGDGPRASSADR